MKTYWEGTVKHQITDENGKLKKVNSVYLVEAVNHTEVEAILTGKMAEIVSGDFTIKPIRQSDISRVVVGGPTGKYFKIKIEMEFDKKETEVVLVEAADLQSALSGFMENEKVLNYDFEVISIVRSKVLDVYDQAVDIYSDPIEDIVGSVNVIHHFPQIEDRVPGDPNLLIDYGQWERKTYSATNTDEAP